MKIWNLTTNFQPIVAPKTPLWFNEMMLAVG